MSPVILLADWTRHPTDAPCCKIPLLPKEIKFENIKELHYIFDNAEPELAFRSMARIAFTRINYEKFELSHENETFPVFLQRKLNE